MFAVLSSFVRVLLGMCLMVGVWLHQAHAALPTSITIAAEDDWPPYSARKAGSTEPEGFTPDLVRAVFKSKGVDVKYETVPYPRCLQLAKTGHAMACFDTTITDENRTEFHWHATPIFEEGLALFARVDEKASNMTGKDLEGRTVGITTGYTYPTDFMRNTNIKKVETNSDELLLKMVLAKRVDFVILNTLPGLLRIKNDKAFTGKIKQAGLISKDGFWLNFSKADPNGKAMADLFEAGLRDFKKSGQYDKMYKDFKSGLGLAP